MGMKSLQIFLGCPTRQQHDHDYLQPSMSVDPINPIISPSCCRVICTWPLQCNAIILLAQLLLFSLNKSFITDSDSRETEISWRRCTRTIHNEQGRLLIKYDSKVSSFMFFNRKQIWRAVTVVKVTVRALGEARLDYEWSCLIDWVWPSASSFQPTIVSLRDLQGSKLIESLLPSFSVLPWGHEQLVLPISARGRADLT
jgi:hypothetical protein